MMSNRWGLFLLGLVAFCSYPLFHLAIPSIIGFFMMLSPIWPEEHKKSNEDIIRIATTPYMRAHIQEIAMRRDTTPAKVWWSLICLGVLFEKIDRDPDSEIVIKTGEEEIIITWDDTGKFRDFKIPGFDEDVD